ncbi:hypothetical protein AK830_g12246 [Neonectria ditissima]|uniref:Uncharacterized protein n=1 Tax=Neonectria ditissima TaxID=78410 RepID=A0A0N8H4U3_9HYPO|nr:hypothetical protein AK830_g12246 [Neonectria ditissima]
MADTADVVGCDEPSAPKLEQLKQRFTEFRTRNEETNKLLQWEMEINARATELLKEPLSTPIDERDYAHSVAVRAFSCVMEDPLLPMEILSHWGPEFAQKLKEGIDLRQGPSISSQSQLILQADMRDTVELDKLRNEVLDLKSQLSLSKVLSDGRRNEMTSLRKLLTEQEHETYRARLSDEQLSRRNEELNESLGKLTKDATDLRQQLGDAVERAALVPELEARIKSLEVDLDNEQQLQAKTNAELNVELDNALQEVQKVTRKFRQLQNTSKQSEGEIADLSAQLSVAVSQIVEKDARIAKILSQNQDLVRNNNILQSECNGRKQEIASRDQKIRKLDLDIQSAGVKNNLYVQYEAQAAALSEAKQKTTSE